MIELIVKGTGIYGKLGSKITSGTVGRRVKFIFDDPWDTLLKTAVFTCNDVTKTCYLEGDECVLPWEVVAHENVGHCISVGVCGMRGDEIVFPTIYTNIGELLQGAVTEYTPSTPHTPDLAEQMIVIAEEALRVANSVREDADNGEFDGDKGDKGDKGDPGKSAYEIAVEIEGFEGTEQEWLDYLKKAQTEEIDAKLQGALSEIKKATWDSHDGIASHFENAVSEIGSARGSALEELENATSGFHSDLDNHYNGISSELDSILTNSREEIEKAKSDAIDEIESTGDIFSNALKGTVSGEAIAITDVSPIEHEMNVKMRSKNIISLPYDWDGAYTKHGITYTPQNDGGIKIEGTVDSDRASTDRNIRTIYCSHLAGKTLCIKDTGDSNIAVVGHVYFNDGTAAAYNYFRTDKENQRVRELPKNASSIYIGIVVKKGSHNTTVYPQLEIGTHETDYTKWVDISSVAIKRCGQNLLDVATADMIANKVSSVISKERTETGIKITLKNGVSSGSFLRAGYHIGATTEMRGKTFTISFGGYASSIADSPRGIYIVAYKDDNAYANDGYVGKSGYYNMFISNNTIGLTALTFTVPYDVNPDFDKIGVMFDINQGSDAVAGDTAEFSNIQVEVGDTATEYEPYVEPVEYSVSADGIVEGVTPIHPTTTLMTDTAGAVMDCTYNRDINKAFEELTNKIIALSQAII